MFEENIIMDTDSYKYSHYLQQEEGTTSVFSYLESRIGSRYGHVLFVGLKYYLRKLEERITVEMVEEAKEFAAGHGEPFNYEGWMYIAKTLKGKLPLEIRAVEEGTIVPVNNVLLTVKNTDPKCWWLTSWVETFLMRIWYPVTVSTRSWHLKRMLMKYIADTSDNPDQIYFSLHDFGARGMTSQESAALAGMAHLVNFRGSDTIVGVRLANKLYHEKMAGQSIPASEHTTIISWGKDREEDAYRNMIKKFSKPGSLFAVVSDSYDLDNAVKNLWGGKLKTEILKGGGTLVIRPDSGNPAEVVLRTLKNLEEKFGITYNTKAKKILRNVKVIQGDGIDEESLPEICETVTRAGYAMDNLAFGMGAGLGQKGIDRDTQRFAYKASEVMVDGQARAISKNPADDATKASKAGKQDLVYRDGRIQTIVGENSFGSLLKVVYRNGDMTPEADITFAKVRENSERFSL